MPRILCYADLYESVRSILQHEDSLGIRTPNNHGRTLMIFGKKPTVENPTEPNAYSAEILVFLPEGLDQDEQFRQSLIAALGDNSVQFADSNNSIMVISPTCKTILCVYQEVAVLRSIIATTKTAGIKPRIILAIRSNQFTDIGSLLHQAAEQDELFGFRLLIADEPLAIVEQLATRLQGECETNIIKMPISPEVENTGYKYFYCISPQLQNLVRSIRELAENNIHRVYLLGGPGAGKTSLAYYYWLCRKKGRFCALNLVAENTGDKTGIKSLLCGHVTGAIPGAASREGALSYAEDGVCFLDESHGMSGAVMEVLMEVLDNSQYLPMGATKKRSLDCAVIFASNRSWQTLLDSLPLDEHARLGATVISISDLCTREEDIIAIVATTLARLRGQFTTWKSPLGLSPQAWKLIQQCRWQGNVRTLIRVLEAATIRYARRLCNDEVLAEEDITEGLKLWEPETHESQKIYASFR